MNLYYAVTNYHLLCCILHAIKYHKDEKNILYLSNWHPDYEELLINLKKSKIFTKVELFLEVRFPSGNKKISKKQIDIDIKKILEDIPENFILDVEKSKEINIAGDHYCSSVYLISNKIQYNYIEEACGVLSDEERLMRIIRNIDYSRYQIMEKLKLPGNHSFIKNRYGDFNSQLEGYFNEKDVHFSVPELLKTLSKKQIYKIVEVFSDEKFELPKNATLLLTFHYVNMQILTMSEQRLLYTLLADYFSKGNLVIKQHPSDVQPDYREWFDSAVILPRKMPSELLPVLSDDKFLRALTAYSTSIFAMKDFCGDVVSFNSSIEKTFKFINKYYFVFQILKDFDFKDYNFWGIGLDDSIVKNVFYHYEITDIDVNYVNDLKSVEKNGKKVIIVGDINIADFDLSLFNDDNIVIWMDSDKLKEFSIKNSKFSFLNFYNILLKKEIIDELQYYDYEFFKDELISFYSCNREFVAYLNSVNIQKTLNYSNFLVKVEVNNVREFLSLDDSIDKLYLERQNLLKKLDDTKRHLELEIMGLKEDNLFKSNELVKYRSQSEHYKKLYDDIVNSSSWRITVIYRKVGGFLKKIVKRR